MRILDVSNSSERPRHRGHGGLLENSVVTMLKKHAKEYEAEFVSSPEQADIIFTNDVYPAWVDNFNLPRVKRMDGVFWQKKNIERNISLNAAAEKSDYVIFISEFSKNQYEELYNPLNVPNKVILNWVDTNYFYPSEEPIQENIVITTASSWKREEKRFSSILYLAHHFKDLQFIFIGKPETKYVLERNLVFTGEIKEPQELASILRRGKGFINLSYRDAAPKVIPEAMCCGLSVFFSFSGGTKEFYPAGQTIQDPIKEKFEEKTPELSLTNLENTFCKFLFQLDKNYQYTRKNFKVYQRRKETLLKNYFDVFSNLKESR
ncbi:MAG: hypothetical protein KKC03_13085 [Bacteroidetes bacterium]|nr:hypothetical protein [Bacteroidota bacterium]